MAENLEEAEDDKTVPSSSMKDEPVWIMESSMAQKSHDLNFKSKENQKDSNLRDSDGSLEHGIDGSSGLSDEWQLHVKTAGASGIGGPKAAKDHTASIKVLENPVPVDRERKVVVVLDDYRYHEMQIKNEFGFSHGELSARMAQENDLNVMRIQIAIGKTSRDLRLDDSLKQLNEQIDSGKIDLRKGDIVNVSFGLSKTYESMSKLLKVDITPENVKEKREEIFQAMRDRLAQGGLNAESRTLLQECVDITDGIKRLQDRGIKVLNAAGNEGPDYINIGFLASDKQYSALEANGKLADYSGKNSFTEDGRASIDLYYLPVDLLDKTPIDAQQGSYRVDGTQIKLPASEFGGRQFERPQFNFQSHLELNKQVQPYKLNAKPEENVSFVKIQAKSEVPDFAEWRKGQLMMHAQGTSFVNVFKMKDEYKRD